MPAHPESVLPAAQPIEQIGGQPFSAGIAAIHAIAGPGLLQKQRCLLICCCSDNSTAAARSMCAKGR
jgi:hypothetical protein